MRRPEGAHHVIHSTDTPRTRACLAADLRELGVQPGMTLMVHASLSALGWVAGGANAVIEALQDVLTPEGTLAMPTFTAGLTDPSVWQNPPVPETWWPIIREETPAYDPRTTPTRGMGAVAEVFRSYPGVRRSAHPHVSVSALGPNATFVTEGHELSNSMGETSPLARLYDLGAFVLLLGTEKNSSLHLAEDRADFRERIVKGAPVWQEGRRVWVTFEDVDYDDGIFPPLKAELEAAGLVRMGRVGSAASRLMSQRDVVDFATRWFRTHAASPEVVS
ncbi:aminoglycoside N(3)-acetyltransferase [Deinococcus pimensis]|uniref:aminoglycoside N(3)-acetyltransferase n=1 Tax=Deinococcus pimensis TaxID=309888 RepID=UPI0005EBAC58|nr:AAC(3) family N-acetyltransferase [Deinococcus pimensis]